MDFVCQHLSQELPFRTLGSVRLLPAGVHLPAFALLVVGFVLWLFGGKMLKPAFAVVGLAIGGFIGALLLPYFLPESLWGVPSPYVGLGVGMLVGVAIAASAFRFALAIAGALVIGAACSVGTGVYLAATGKLNLAPDTTDRSLLIEQEQSDLGNEITRATDVVREASRRMLEHQTDVETPEAHRQLQEHSAAAAARVKTVASEMKQDAQSFWSRLPGPSRFSLIGGFTGGCMLGLLLGAFMPQKTAGVITAMSGAAMVLGAGTWILHAGDIGAFGLTDKLVNLGPIGWAILWTLATLIGLYSQRRLGEKKGEKTPQAKPTPA